MESGALDYLLEELLKDPSAGDDEAISIPNRIARSKTPIEVNLYHEDQRDVAMLPVSSRVN